MASRFTAVALVVALAALGGAQLVRGAAVEMRPPALEDEPYAPSQDSARVVSLGFNEVAADLLAVRLVGYFGGGETTGNGLISLVEAIVTLDPQLRWVYEWGARVATLGKHGVDNAIFLRAAAVLERGAKQFPTDYRMLNLAGQIYTQDLVTDDPTQRRAWDEKGTLAVEAAIRRPGAPAEIAVWASVMRTKFGQRQRAIDELKEMFLVTDDAAARQKIIDRLATLVDGDRLAIAAEVLDEKQRFEKAWKAARPGLPATMYLLLGPPATTQPFDMTDLATGGRDLIDLGDVREDEPLDPLR